MLSHHTPYGRLTNVVTATVPLHPPMQPNNHSVMNSRNWSAAGIARDIAAPHGYLEAVFATPELQAVAQDALERLALRPGQRVLEAGCGPGLFLAPLAAAVGAAGEVVGIDLSPDFVAAAAGRVAALGNVIVQQADVLHLPFPDGTFDAAHCERLLMHLADPTAALAELRRVLKPGGVLVATEPDWLGGRTDHPDQDLVTMVGVRGTAALAQPAMGLLLPGHLAAAGFGDVTARPLTFVHRHSARIAQFGLDVQRVIGELRDDGTITPQRAEAALAWLARADRDGTFFAYGSMVTASGRA